MSVHYELHFPGVKVFDLVDHFIDHYTKVFQLYHSDIQDDSLKVSLGFMIIEMEEIFLSADLKELLLEITDFLGHPPCYIEYEKSGIPCTSYFFDDSL